MNRDPPPFDRRAALGVVTATSLVVALSAALASCCSFNDVCTLATCNDGLQVVLKGPLPANVAVEAITVGGERRTEQCVDVDPCAVLFEGFHPDDVTVRVAWDGDLKVVTARPKYTEYRPNGRCCPPTCRTATVSIDL